MQRRVAFGCRGIRIRFPGAVFPRARCSDEGAGLLEVIVAVAILLVSMTILAQLVLSGMDQSRMARDRARGALLAQERMEELLAHRDDLTGWQKRVEKAFPFDPEAQMYRFDRRGLGAFYWAWEIKPAENIEGLKEAVVRVHWHMPRRKVLTQKCALHTLVADRGNTPSPSAKKEAGE